MAMTNKSQKENGDITRWRHSIYIWLLASFLSVKAHRWLTDSWWSPSQILQHPKDKRSPCSLCLASCGKGEAKHKAQQLKSGGISPAEYNYGNNRHSWLLFILTGRNFSHASHATKLAQQHLPMLCHKAHSLNNTSWLNNIHSLNNSSWSCNALYLKHRLTDYADVWNEMEWNGISKSNCLSSPGLLKRMLFFLF